MAIELFKGDRINLSKELPTLKKIMVGLGWDMMNQTIDLDVSVFMLGENGKIPEDRYFVFYNNLKSADGAVQHTGDNRTGDGDGDDEMILVNLPQVHESVKEILFVVSIYDQYVKGQHFGLLKNAFIRLYDIDAKKEVLKFSLDQFDSSNTALEFGKLIRNNDGWYFHAIGDLSKKNLKNFVEIYA